MRKGFTLIELLIVITAACILIVLIGVALSDSDTHSVEEPREKSHKEKTIERCEYLGGVYVNMDCKFPPVQ